MIFSSEHIQQCCAHLKKYVETYNAGDMELEFRLGRIIKLQQNEKFDPNICQKPWETLWRALSQYRDWEQIHTEIITDYTLPNKHRLTHVDDDTWRTIVKTRLADHDIVTEAAFDVRISISTEMSLPQKLPQPQTAIFVRHKDRISFQKFGWSFDFTKVRAQSECTDEDTTEAYEIEVELIDKKVLELYPLEQVIQTGLALCDDLFQVSSHF